MRDKVSIERANLLHPRIRDEVKLLIENVEFGLPPNRAIRIVQGLRTFEEQQALYNQGRSKPGPIVTNARPGSSFHQYGLAIDFAVVVDKNGDGLWDVLSWDINLDADRDGVPEWREMERVFSAAGYEWGGYWRTFKDYPHLQRSFGYTWRQLLDKYNKKDFLPGTRYVRI